MKKIIWVIVLLGFFGLSVSVVRAALSYGSGYYVNLCESGTAATYYNCNSGCDPNRGSCSSNNSGVVKWVCLGKWNQCLESESQWSNYEQVENIGCGYTVQLSLFDKKCRREDGSWDNTCRLLGYMVWYSGDCWEGGVQVTPRPLPTRIFSPTPFPTSKLTMNPTAVLASKLSNEAAAGKIKPTVTPTPIPLVKVCGMKCQKAIDCQAGFACVDAVCRNPICPADKSCFCQGNVATSSANLTRNPSTGVETWVGMAGMVGLFAFGLRMKRIAKRVW